MWKAGCIQGVVAVLRGTSKVDWEHGLKEGFPEEVTPEWKLKK